MKKNNINILIVEDSKMFLEIYKKMLSDAGYLNVFEAGNGEEAIYILKNEDIDIVITDIIMPELDGIELLKFIDKTYPEIKTIALTAVGFLTPETYLHNAKMHNVNITFSKPIDKAMLIKTIENLL